MTEQEVHNFEKTQAQLDSIYQEISVLSKKKQDDALSIFKLKLVNKILDEVNLILGDTYKPFDDFDKFDEDNIPTNSDVVLVLGQYLECMEKLRADRIKNISGSWYWVLEENKNLEPRDSRFRRIETKRPQKI